MSNAAADHPKSSSISYSSSYLYLILLIPVSVLAFWKTYFEILGALPDDMSVMVHIHATLMFLWLMMLIAQAWLARTRRYQVHRWLGRSSFLVAPLIILTGLLTLQGFFRKMLDDPAIEAIFRLHILAFGMILAFAITWGLAIIYRKRVDLHMRFMISTVLATGSAIVFRIFYYWVPGFDGDDIATLANFCVLSLAALVLIAADWRSGETRSVYWVVAGIQGAAHLGYWTFAATDGWYTFCRWFTNLPAAVG